MSFSSVRFGTVYRLRSSTGKAHADAQTHQAALHLQKCLSDQKTPVVAFQFRLNAHEPLTDFVITRHDVKTFAGSEETLPLKRKKLKAFLQQAEVVDIPLKEGFLSDEFFQKHVTELHQPIIERFLDNKDMVELQAAFNAFDTEEEKSHFALSLAYKINNQSELEPFFAAFKTETSQPMPVKIYLLAVLIRFSIALTRKEDLIATIVSVPEVLKSTHPQAKIIQAYIVRTSPKYLQPLLKLFLTS